MNPRERATIIVMALFPPAAVLAAWIALKLAEHFEWIERVFS